MILEILLVDRHILENLATLSAWLVRLFNRLAAHLVVLHLESLYLLDAREELFFKRIC